MSGLVLEVKGDFCHQLRGLMRQHGRADDYLEISLDAPYHYNPLHNENILISGGTGKTGVLNALADLLRAGEWQSGPACGSCRTCGSRRGHHRLPQGACEMPDETSISHSFHKAIILFAGTEEALAVETPTMRQCWCTQTLSGAPFGPTG